MVFSPPGSSDLWVSSDRFSYLESSSWTTSDYKVTLQYGLGAASGRGAQQVGGGRLQQ